MLHLLLLQLGHLVLLLLLLLLLEELLLQHHLLLDVHLVTLAHVSTWVALVTKVVFVLGLLDNSEVLLLHLEVSLFQVLDLAIDSVDFTLVSTNS